MPKQAGSKWKEIIRKRKHQQYNKYYRHTSPEYKTSRWLKLRQLKLNHSPLCEMCLKQGITTPAVLVHHIKPIEDGGKMYQYENLMSLCSECHNKIHMSFRKNSEQNREDNK